MNDDHDMDPLARELTEQERAEIEAMCHVPGRDELRELLVRYFEAPITEDVVDRVETDFLQVRSNRGAHMGHRRHFESPTRWRGTAWNEDFTGNRRGMTPSDLVLMLANMIADHDPSFPQPRLYCPETFVGTWEQLEPAPPPDEQWQWHLSADGTFRCNSPEVPDSLIRWCMHHSPRRDTLSLVLQSQYSRAGWSIWGITPSPTEIFGEYLGFAGNTPYRLRRVS